MAPSQEELLSTSPIRPPASEEAAQKFSSAVFHRNLREETATVSHAKGCWITLDTGRRVLDATGGAAVACLGHNHPRITEAARLQMEKISYCHSLFFSTPAAEQLATALCASTNGHMTRAFVVSSGSEAMEAALKLARQYFIERDGANTKRDTFIARHSSYHGATLGALSVSGHTQRRAKFLPLLSHNTRWVSPCYPYRGCASDESLAEYVTRLEKELEDEFQAAGPETVVAFIMEPVVGAALGCVPAVPGYLAAARRVCDRHGALLLVDEVMCGLGRCGNLHAWMDAGLHGEVVRPDLQTLGKGLGAGYAPVAAVLASQKVVEVLARGTGVFAHGQTYQGHPVGCAVALEVQRVMHDEALVENVRAMGQLLEMGLRQRLGHLPYVGDIRGRGLFWGIEFVQDRATKTPFPVAENVAATVHSEGTGSVEGTRGDHVIVAPPYNVTQAEVEEIVDRTECAIVAAFAQLEEMRKNSVK